MQTTRIELATKKEMKNTNIQHPIDLTWQKGKN
jgi:hypothetical protein